MHAASKVGTAKLNHATTSAAKQSTVTVNNQKGPSNQAPNNTRPSAPSRASAAVKPTAQACKAPVNVPMNKEVVKDKKSTNTITKAAAGIVPKTSPAPVKGPATTKIKPEPRQNQESKKPTGTSVLKNPTALCTEPIVIPIDLVSYFVDSVARKSHFLTIKNVSDTIKFYDHKLLETAGNKIYTVCSGKPNEKSEIVKSKKCIIKRSKKSASAEKLIEFYREYHALQTLSKKSQCFPKVEKFAWSVLYRKELNGAWTKKWVAELKMEYCGETLSAKNKPSSTYTADNLLIWLDKCVETLQNSQIQLHGDLKPMNICVMKSDSRSDSEDDIIIKIIDVGLAYINAPPDKCQVLQYTKGYASPEVLEAAEKSIYLQDSQKADVYSLGVTFLELACKMTEADIKNFRSVVTKNPRVSSNLDRFEIKVDKKPLEELYLKKVLSGMLQADYKKRLNYSEIKEIMTQYKIMRKEANRMKESYYAKNNLLEARMADAFNKKQKELEKEKELNAKRHALLAGQLQKKNEQALKLQKEKEDLVKEKEKIEKAKEEELKQAKKLLQQEIEIEKAKIEKAKEEELKQAKKLHQQEIEIEQAKMKEGLAKHQQEVSQQRERNQLLENENKTEKEEIETLKKQYAERLKSANFSRMQKEDLERQIQKMNVEQGNTAAALEKQKLQTDLLEKKRKDDTIKRLQKQIKDNEENLSHFICLFTHDIPSDPVLAEDGQIYERRSITEWLRNKRTSPKTRQIISTKLLPVYNVKAAVESIQNQKKKLEEELDEIMKGHSDPLQHI